jgi:hypothetical protein
MSSVLIIGETCLKLLGEDENCIHVVKDNLEDLQIWDIRDIRNNIFSNKYDKIIFTGKEEMNFVRGEDVFEKSKTITRLYHFIGNGNIKKSLSNL